MWSPDYSANNLDFVRRICRDVHFAPVVPKLSDRRLADNNVCVEAHAGSLWSPDYIENNLDFVRRICRDVHFAPAVPKLSDRRLADNSVCVEEHMVFLYSISGASGLNSRYV